MPNNRQLTLRQSVRFSLSLLFWLPVSFFSLLLVYNTLHYFSFSSNYSFIQERAMLFARSAYRYSFYFHIAAGIICVSTALIQFSSTLLKKRKAIHIWSGRLYVMAVLAIGAPSGMYMSFFAKGSNWERGLFMFMALFWFFTTLKGLQSIWNKNVLAHKQWMIRSYAMAMTAVSFRIYYLVFFLLDVDLLLNYEISLWMAVLGNMLVAEWIAYRKAASYLKTFLH